MISYRLKRLLFLMNSRRVFMFHGYGYGYAYESAVEE